MKTRQITQNDETREFPAAAVIAYLVTRPRDRGDSGVTSAPPSAALQAPLRGSSSQGIALPYSVFMSVSAYGGD